MARKVIPFTEESMRKYSDVNTAIKVYSEYNISTRKIIRLYQSTFTIKVGTRYFNIASFNQIPKDEQIKYLDTLFKGNRILIQSFQTAVVEWNNKFGKNGSDTGVVTPIQEDKTAKSLNA